MKTFFIIMILAGLFTLAFLRGKSSHHCLMDAQRLLIEAQRTQIAAYKDLIAEQQRAIDLQRQLIKQLETQGALR